MPEDVLHCQSGRDTHIRIWEKNEDIIMYSKSVTVFVLLSHNAWYLTGNGVFCSFIEQPVFQSRQSRGSVFFSCSSELVCLFYSCFSYLPDVGHRHVAYTERLQVLKSGPISVWSISQNNADFVDYHRFHLDSIE